MNKRLLAIIALLAFCACSNAAPEAMENAAKTAAEAEKQSQSTAEKTTTYTSPSGVTEQCVALAKIPGGDYSKKDLETENLYCSLNFYSGPFALCPKTWSTSPATMVYDLSDSQFSTSSYESSQYCGQKSRGPEVKTFAKFKQTMNASGTSGTFSQSSLMYYHFSRYFDAKAFVPVSVYRDMDRRQHKERVAERGFSRATAKMNKAGWRHLLNAVSNPSSYSPTSDLFTDEGNLYGILIRGKGERYGTEFNGTRASGWGKGQNRDFQKTPGFLALRKSGTLAQAIDYGIEQAAKDSTMRRDLRGLDGMQGEVQVALWMRELIEITLLDYIFSQQDRVGNIDYRWYWAYVDGDKVKFKREKRDQYEDKSRRSMGDIPVPADLAALNPVLVQRTQLNDNDAGGRVAYANFSKSTGMLTKLKHYSAKTYNKLMALDRDLQSQGPVYQWLANSIDLTDRRIRQVVSNTHLAANILREQCSDLRFDLDDIENYMAKGDRTESVDCNQ